VGLTRICNPCQARYHRIGGAVEARQGAPDLRPFSWWRRGRECCSLFRNTQRENPRFLISIRIGGAGGIGTRYLFNAMKWLRERNGGRRLRPRATPRQVKPRPTFAYREMAPSFVANPISANFDVDLSPRVSSPQRQRTIVALGSGGIASRYPPHVSTS